MPHDCYMSYEDMWEIIFKLSEGYAQGGLARLYGVSKSHINAIAKEYDVGRRAGQSRRSVKRESHAIAKQLMAGETPQVTVNVRKRANSKAMFPLRIRKDLLLAEEKARIQAAIVANPERTVVVHAREFKRLPATIVKIAAEAGITLR